ncbi:hypothetical protein ANANG_G00257390 [Anguilla anguilla]|uniref:Hypermethylated in cancer 2 protein n=1 Tax=Anguilla anguilla TaxID=7936 RepID=A0A9D3RNH8_ANGAN|nr:hypothetical protein ANANG_G00257390 [Anguilla anguilla]
MELPNHAKQLLLQLNQQRAKGFLCDVIIVVENALFRAHKNILAASSIYFKSLMLHDNLINLDTEMVNPSVFRQILDFIYTGKLLSSEPSSEQNFTALLTAASYLQLHDLAALCRKKLKRSGKPLPAKPCTPTGGRPLRTQRLSSMPLVLARFSGAKESEKKERRAEPASDRLSDEEHGEGAGQAAGGGSNGSGGGEPAARPGPVQKEPLRRHGDRRGEPQQQHPSGVPAPLHIHSQQCLVRRPPAGRRRRAHGPGEAGAQEERQALPGLRKSSRQIARKKEGGEGGRTPARSRAEGFEPALGDNLYVCIPCGKGFPSSEQLNAHVETHTEEELYIKEEDSYAKEATEAEDLSSQAAPPAAAFGAGSEPRPFKCTMFTQRGTMTRHMRSHLGLKPFACEECGMRFTRQYRLTEHMRVHSGEKPYECQLCGGKFTQQRNLISHLRMHTSPS